MAVALKRQCACAVAHAHSTRDDVVGTCSIMLLDLSAGSIVANVDVRVRDRAHAIHNEVLVMAQRSRHNSGRGSLVCPQTRVEAHRRCRPRGQNACASEIHCGCHG